MPRANTLRFQSWVAKLFGVYNATNGSSLVARDCLALLWPKYNEWGPKDSRHSKRGLFVVVCPHAKGLRTVGTKFWKKAEVWLCHHARAGGLGQPFICLQDGDVLCCVVQWAYNTGYGIWDATVNATAAGCICKRTGEIDIPNYGRSVSCV